MKEIVASSRLDQLKALRDIIAESIDEKPGARDLAQLAKQYREIIAEIEGIEGVNKDGNEVSKILSARKADGKSGSVR